MLVSRLSAICPTTRVRMRPPRWILAGCALLPPLGRFSRLTATDGAARYRGANRRPVRHAVAKRKIDPPTSSPSAWEATATPNGLGSADSRCDQHRGTRHGLRGRPSRAEPQRRSCRAAAARPTPARSTSPTRTAAVGRPAGIAAASEAKATASISPSMKTERQSVVTPAGQSRKRRTIAICTTSSSPEPLAGRQPVF